MRRAVVRLIGVLVMLAIVLALSLTLPAQQNIVTMFGCLSGTNCTTQAVAVNATGQLLVSNNYTAGSGTATYKAPGTLFWDNTNTANAGDTNFVKSATYSIPAATAVANGDWFDVNAIFSIAAVFTSTRSYVCNVGFTSWSAAGGFTGGQNIISSGTASTTASSIWAHGTLSRLTATTFGLFAANTFTGSTSVQGTNYATGSLTWSNAQNFACEAKDGTGNAAAITINEVRLDWHPYF